MPTLQAVLALVEVDRWLIHNGQQCSRQECICAFSAACGRHEHRQEYLLCFRAGWHDNRPRLRDRRGNPCFYWMDNRRRQGRLYSGRHPEGLKNCRRDRDMKSPTVRQLHKCRLSRIGYRVSAIAFITIRLECHFPFPSSYSPTQSISATF